MNGGRQENKKKKKKEIKVMKVIFGRFTAVWYNDDAVKRGK